MVIVHVHVHVKPEMVEEMMAEPRGSVKYAEVFPEAAGWASA